MSDMTSAASTVGRWALGVAAGIAVLAWTPNGRGEAVLWAVTLVTLVIGVLALTTMPRLLGRYQGPIALAVTGIRDQRAAERETRDDNKETK